MLVLFFVALWFIQRGGLLYVFPCVILFLCFSSPFSIAITSLGEERANLSAFRTFVRFVLVWICRFPLPLGVWEGLRFVIVALPGLFTYNFFSSLLLCGLLAHLSRRLIGEFIIWQGCCLCLCRVITFSNVFFSGTTRPIEVKFHVKPPWDGETKFCMWGPGHMNKIAAMPIYDKNPLKILFSRTAGPIYMKFSMWHLGRRPIMHIWWSWNDLNLFRPRSNLVA